MGAEVGRGSLVDGEMGESRTRPGTRLGGVGGAESGISDRCLERFPANAQRSRSQLGFG